MGQYTTPAKVTNVRGPSYSTQPNAFETAMTTLASAFAGRQKREQAEKGRMANAFQAMVNQGMVSPQGGNQTMQFGGQGYNIQPPASVRKPLLPSQQKHALDLAIMTGNTQAPPGWIADKSNRLAEDWMGQPGMQMQLWKLQEEGKQDEAQKLISSIYQRADAVTKQRYGQQQQMNPTGQGNQMGGSKLKKPKNVPQEAWDKATNAQKREFLRKLKQGL